VLDQVVRHIQHPRLRLGVAIRELQNDMGLRERFVTILGERHRDATSTDNE
jgi:hypothetical protein